MKIVIAPDSFKGSLTAAQACAAIAAGVLRAVPDAETVSVPMADGGEGTVQSLIDALGGSFIECMAEDPLGRPVNAVYGITNDGIAIIEMSAASGLILLSEDERDPRLTSTYGTGQLIMDALDRGARDFILGIGGSATNDGGAGMAQALGFRFVFSGETFSGKQEEALCEKKDMGTFPRARFGGGALGSLARIEPDGVDARLAESRFTVACDVDNPLCGPNGASAVFGPQKGATPEQASLLDTALSRLAGCVSSDLGKEVRDIPGAGAAGGLGAGCIAFLGAELKRGVDIVIEATGLAEKLAGAALVITGEGRTDIQTLGGKTAHGVALLAKSLGVPAIVISGSLAEGAEKMLKCGVWRLYSLVDGGITTGEAMRNGEAFLKAKAESAVREFLTEK